MNLAAMLLFGIWVSIVVMVMFGWILMTIGKQDKSIYSDWDDMDDDTFQDGVG